MTTRRFIATSAALLQFVGAMATPTIQAQVTEGVRVRVTTGRPTQQLVGAFVSADEDSLRVTSLANGATVAVAAGSVTRFERSRGRRSQAGRGAAIGGLLGAGTGLLIGLMAATDGSGFYEVGGGEIIAAGLILGVAGGTVGGLIGATSHKERWDRVPVPGSSRVNRGPKPLVRVTIRF